MKLDARLRLHKYWTPPHSWALAILVNKDYAGADILVMPVARGENVTRFQILFYSIQLVIISLSPALLLWLPQVSLMLDRFYLAFAAILGLLLIGLMIHLYVLDTS